jgi:pimeloyl-ACP methyl ester carboxylesterase
MSKFERENVTLHYEIQGTDQPLVYISGFSDHSNSVFSIGLRHVLSEKYQVLSLDNRGSGQTIVRDNASTTIEDMADDVAAVLKANDISTAHILGVSMGGAIAQVFALRHPELVRTLVIAVSMAVTQAPSRAEFLLETAHKMRSEGIEREIINRFTATFLLGEATFQYQQFMDAWINAPEDPLHQTSEGFEQQKNALRGFDIRKQIGAINVPTLVVSSSDDVLVPPRFQDEIAELIPNARIKRYPGGHIFMGLPMYQAPFLEDIVAFWEQN